MLLRQPITGFADGRTAGLALARELHFGTDNYGADALTRLREWPHLRGLSLSYLMKPWAELAALPHLRALKLDNPDWTMIPELHKARLPNLRLLEVRDAISFALKDLAANRSLARLELEISVRTMLSRFPDLEVVEAQRRPTFVLRGFERLVVSPRA